MTCKNWLLNKITKTVENFKIYSIIVLTVGCKLYPKQFSRKFRGLEWPKKKIASRASHAQLIFLSLDTVLNCIDNSLQA